jgi:myo-inositol-1-phosphate synthase
MSHQKIRVALVGVGNCASALIQGVEFYRDADENEFVPGLMHVNLGGYHVRDIEFVAAFDVSTEKVGKDLSEAMFAAPNNTIKFCEVARLGVTVQRGNTADGWGNTSVKLSNNRRNRLSMWRRCCAKRAPMC